VAVVKKHRRYQPALYDERGRRVPRVATAASVNPEIEAALTATARRFKKSRSWVQNFINGEFFGIAVEPFDED
jgi:hypothetical protein